MSRELDCTHLNPVRFLACRAVGRSQDPPGAEEGAATPHPVGAREDQAGLERRVKVFFNRGRVEHSHWSRSRQILSSGWLRSPTRGSFFLLLCLHDIIMASMHAKDLLQTLVLDSICAS